MEKKILKNIIMKMFLIYIQDIIPELSIELR